MHRVLGITALVTWAVTLVAVLAAPVDRHDTAETMSAAVAPPGPAAPLRGMSLNVYHAEDFERYLVAADRVAAMGFDTLQIVTPVFMRDGAAPRVEVLTGPGRGPRGEDLVALLRRAEALGLRTILMPQVNLTDPRGNEWRGKIQPPRWGPWWESYERMIDRFLGVAVEGGVEVFTVGCELLTTEKPEHRERWRSIIVRCRGRYGGRLTYSTVWNHTHAPPFWADLDLVGVSGYWDLTRGAADPHAPTRDELEGRWGEIRRHLQELAESTGRPVLITELGYPSVPWALKDPWNYVAGDARPDADAQARGFESFADNWSAPGPDDERLAGVVLYKWDVYQEDAETDTGYGIEGKPAEAVIRRWLGGE